MTKEEIRNQIRDKKRSLTKTQIKASGEELIRQAQQFAPYMESNAVYLFASYNQEIDTYGLICHALQMGKKVALPKVEGEDICFYLIAGLNDLSSGYQGIPEPMTGIKAIPTVAQQPLMLLPGLAFSKTGERLGYGGGFYDRYLSSLSEEMFTTCAIGYSFQVLPTVPVEVHDKRVDYIMTPAGVICCSTK